MAKQSIDDFLGDDTSSLGSIDSFLGEAPSQPSGLGGVISTPQRGLRGLTVGALEAGRQLGPQGVGQVGLAALTQDPSFLPPRAQVQDALEAGLLRSAEAVDPEFTPKDLAEKITAGATELGFELGAAAAVAGPASIGLGAKILRGGLSGATIATLDQSIRNKDVTVDDIQVGAGLGMAVPLIGPTVAGATKIGRGLMRLIASGSRTLKPESVRTIEQTAGLADDALGDPKKIAQIIKTMQRKLTGAHRKVGQKLNKMRKNIGFTDDFVDDGVKISDPNFRPKETDNILDSFNVLRGSSPDPKVKLRELMRLRQDTQRLFKFRELQSKQGFALKPLTGKADKIFGSQNKVKQFTSLVEKEIQSIPGGKAQLAVNKAYSISKQMVDNLTKSLGNPNTAALKLEKLVEGKFGEVVDLDGNTLALLRRLERRSGFRFLDDLQKNFTLKEIIESLPTGPIGLVGEATTPVGIVRGLQGTQRAVEGGEAISRGLTSPAVRAGSTLGLQRGFEEQ